MNWRDALTEHDEVLRAWVARLEAVPDEEWTIPSAPGKWTPAELALHVIRAYELCGPDEPAGMRLLVNPLWAWSLRTFYLPRMLERRTFPTGIKAPREVRPDTHEAHGTSRAALMSRLELAAARAAETLHGGAERTPELRVRHAFFGPLAPLPAMRLLSAHTRHHTRSAIRRIAVE
jgi:hypothetical protein